MKERQRIRYSEAFKRQIVEEVESGKHCSINAVNRLYGIRGSLTVQRWLKIYGRGDYVPKQIKIMSPQEIDETKELKQRVRLLERALADSQMRNLLNESFLDIACERMNTDSETFKKKHATEPSGLPRKKDPR